MTRDRELHWPEYLMEAAGLGLFMVSAGLLTLLLEHPSSPAHQAIPDALARRTLMGLGIGATAVGLIYSPWGQQSGAHLNPAVTVTFLRLGKIAPHDALLYVVFQFIGGLLGVLAVLLVFGSAFSEPPVAFVATVPGPEGALVAFVAEVFIAFGLMCLVLWTTNTPRFATLTGWLVGALLALYITFEAPFSGMSLNPARTLASAFPGAIWSALWVYFTAPFIGMLAAAELYRRRGRVRCAKFNHTNDRRCIFRCGYHSPSLMREPQP